MGNLENKKTFNAKTRNPLFQIFVVAAFFVFVVLMCLNHYNVSKREAQLHELNAKIQMQETENLKIGNEIKNSDDAEYIERIAREKYGYVRSGDRVYVNTK